MKKKRKKSMTGYIAEDWSLDKISGVLWHPPVGERKKIDSYAGAVKVQLTIEEID